jgi:seryl-tRNA synthetase
MEMVSVSCETCDSNSTEVNTCRKLLKLVTGGNEKRGKLEKQLSEIKGHIESSAKNKTSLSEAIKSKNTKYESSLKTSQMKTVEIYDKKCSQIEKAIDEIKNEQLEKLQSDFDKLKASEVLKLQEDIESIKKNELASFAEWESFIFKSAASLIAILLAILIGVLIVRKLKA